MLKEVVLGNKTYSNVEHVVLKDSAGNDAVFSETTGTTAAAGDIRQGKTAFCNGEKVTGAMKLTETTIFSNGTFNAADYGAAGFSKIIAEVPLLTCLPGDFDETASGDVTLGEDSANFTSVDTALAMPIRFAMIYSSRPKNSYNSWVIASFFISSNSGDDLQCIITADSSGAIKVSAPSTPYSINGSTIESFGSSSGALWKAGEPYYWFAMG